MTLTQIGDYLDALPPTDRKLGGVVTAVHWQVGKCFRHRTPYLLICQSSSLSVGGDHRHTGTEMDRIFEAQTLLKVPWHAILWMLIYRC